MPINPDHTYTIVADPEDDDLSYVLNEDGIPVARMSDNKHAIDAFTALTWGVVKNPGDPVTFQTVEEAVPGQAERSWQRFELV
ncbi:hypothetical protein [Mycolicibacterium fallax]|uniref:Uncharacterized protein n=1 Tax=Mycolicibacterium fallax TaxID=1793 RepID=A0A1X1RJ49_MYCFA|nr:hypothetical protein [Mycolicibacterium fallax]MCB0929848.1 hypothetical protein [Mycobacterium sp.]ORV07560.1 hypothetical protein AWC04_03870 [Mycolicibacterium fallax]BBY99475.1 hypothetical protein MFAL_29420 [Mycolicibacterium fallax]